MEKNLDSLAEKVHHLESLQQRFVHKELKKIGLNMSQARTLDFLAVYPNVIQTDLADYLGKQKATVTNLLKVLENKNLVERKQSTDNARQKKLSLSTSGNQKVLLIQAIFAKLDKKLTGNLATSEIDELNQQFARLIDAF